MRKSENPFPRKQALVLEVIGLCTWFFDMTYALGFTFGALVAFGLYFSNMRYWNRVVDAGSVSQASGVAHTMLHNVVVLLALFVGIKIPTILNVYAIAAGLFIIKLSYLLSNHKS